MQILFSGVRAKIYPKHLFSEEMSFNKVPNVPGSPALSVLLKVSVIGRLGVYALTNSLYNVDGGHRAVMFNRLTGIKEKVLEFVSTVHDLCAVLGLDFLSTVTEVHPSLDEANGVQTKSISNETLARLAKTVLTLKEDKMQRLKKLQELDTQLTDLWNLMDTPDEERELFDHVTCNISASVHEVTVSGALALDLIEQAEVEVDRLDQLKSSRMKEIAFKKQSQLEDIYMLVLT